MVAEGQSLGTLGLRTKLLLRLFYVLGSKFCIYDNLSW